MVLAQALPFPLHVASVSRIAARDALPIELEVAADAVATLRLPVRLLRPLQQRPVVPGRAVEHRCRARRRRHRPELLIELLRVHVLRLVDLQQRMRRMTDNVAPRFRRQEELPRPPDRYRATVLAC